MTCPYPLIMQILSKSRLSPASATKVKYVCRILVYDANGKLLEQTPCDDKGKFLVDVEDFKKEKIIKEYE